jgi:hypothetical protein
MRGCTDYRGTAGEIMEQIGLTLFLSVIPAVLCGLLLVMIILEKKENRLLSRQLTETVVSLELLRKQLGELEEKNVEIDRFHHSLREAEVTTRLQQPRLEAQLRSTDIPPSGKYGNIRELTGKGLSIEEIASVLAVSIHEAHQLVNLAKLAR